MFRKFFSVLLVLILAGAPVYAEEEQDYSVVYPEREIFLDAEDFRTLQPGVVYQFYSLVGKPFEIEFSDCVLWGGTFYSNGYKDVSIFEYSDYVEALPEDGYRIFVYNIHDREVSMRIPDKPDDFRGAYFNSNPLNLVTYNGYETPFQVSNNTDDRAISYKQFEYDGAGGYVEGVYETMAPGEVHSYIGKGFLLFSLYMDDLENSVTCEGVYKLTDYIDADFFRVPPWILEMDLTGVIRGYLEQLSMLLPVGLVILSAFLVISLMRFIMRLFL